MSGIRRKGEGKRSMYILFFSFRNALLSAKKARKRIVEILCTRGYLSLYMMSSSLSIPPQRASATRRK